MAVRVYKLKATLICCVLAILCFLAYTLTVVVHTAHNKNAIQHLKESVSKQFNRIPELTSTTKNNVPTTDAPERESVARQFNIIPELTTTTKNNGPTTDAPERESVARQLHVIPELTPTTKNNGPTEDTSGVWVYDKEDDATVNRKQSTGHEDASCYPRLLAMDGTEAAPPSSCKNTRSRSSSELKPKKHVFFLKTHKTGSLTLTTILNRYALIHKLTVPKANGPKWFQGNVYDWSHYFAPPPRALGHYDMITNHLAFNESCVKLFLPRDSILISVVREPLQRFISCFYFCNLQRFIPGPDPLLAFLSHPQRFDSVKKLRGKPHSRYQGEFGLDFAKLDDPQYLPTALQNLSRVFHLVMLTEAFDESMVLLKRTLSWKLPEMIYAKFHVAKLHPAYNFTEELKRDMEKRLWYDYVMYRHFRAEFYRKLQAQDDSFAEEVRVFKAMRTQVDSFCQSITAAAGPSSGKKQELLVEGTAFSDRFRMTMKDCELLQQPKWGRGFLHTMRERIQKV